MPRSFRVLIAVCALLVSVLAGSALAKNALPAPSVDFTRFVLSGGTTSGGVTNAGGTLQLSGADDGAWLSPPAPVAAFDQLVASWNATTPANTWITVQMSATGSDRTTKWYTMGIWTSEPVVAHRTSVSGQGDANGFVAIDTFIRSKKAAPLDSYQVRVELHRSGTSATPTVRFVGAMTSADVAKYDIPSAPLGGGSVRDDLGVPPYSQEIHRGEFPDLDGGGEAWCSPTSTEMVVEYWNEHPDTTGIPYEDPSVDSAAMHTFDWHYTGTGNWPFNVAYAGSYGLDARLAQKRRDPNTDSAEIDSDRRPRCQQKSGRCR